MTPSPWRSLLYVPAHEENFIVRAHERGADALILDLEDGVPEHAKLGARAALAAAVPRLKGAGVTVLVRIDHAWRRAWLDLEAAVSAGADGVVVPKVCDAGVVRVLSAYLSELEGEAGRETGSTPLVALIEDARGLLEARAIAACGRVIALIPGNEDLALDLDADPDADVFQSTHMHLLLAARAEGKVALGMVGSGAGFRDLEEFRERAVYSRRRGFSGATCIHPAQVAVLNEVYAPSEAELERARRIVEAFDAAGGGVVVVDGTMVDRPVAARARAVLARGRGDGGT